MNQRKDFEASVDFLNGVDHPGKVRDMDFDQLERLASHCRNRIIEVTSKAGGHLASSLGTVELTVALYHVFDAEKDVFVWDVGHQGYTHKLLTGRSPLFDRIGQRGGVGKFLRREESRFDHFGAGHASTSISASLGMAVARGLKGENREIVALIGDGAMTGGLSYEAMNHAGHLNANLTVILNDNDMSIDPNVGALSKTFNTIQTSPLYNAYRREITKIEKSGRISGFIRNSLKRANDSFMEFLSPASWFEKLGFRYFGPIDGHSVKSVVGILKATRNIRGPVLIHVTTLKGKGYEFAEGDSLKYHGVTPFIPESGKMIPKQATGKSYTAIWSETFAELFERDAKVTATSAAMIGSVGLKKLFEKHPDRVFDVGIAEAHAVTFNAGLAAAGMKPFVAIYSTFLQRALDSVIHDVALQNLPVRFVLDRAGYVGADGATHHGAFDLTYLRMVPNMVLMSPKDGKELRAMLLTLYDYGAGPCAVRFPRGNVSVYPEEGEPVEAVPVGQGELLLEGEKILVCAIGSMVEKALLVARRLEETAGFLPTVVNARFVKPLDEALICPLARRSLGVVTIEENAVSGGFGSGVSEMLAERSIHKPLRRCGMPDRFIEYGKPEEQLEDAGLTVEKLCEAIAEFLQSLESPEAGG